ncbi:MAG: ATP-binding protein [Desulfobacula sp.]|nr:ATP-binding protein [Desulfobacula sp.]
MSYIKRDLEKHLLYMATKYPVVTLTGPRQSGKSTLVQHAFLEKPYISCEDPDIRLFADQDPRGFLQTYPNAVIDEAQKVPQIFSYIQTMVDKTDEPGQFVLTGSSDFLLFEKITQSLAGRTAVLRLLPFSLNEIHDLKGFEHYEEYLFNGFYPRLYKMNIQPVDFYPGYMQTYIERDVRTIKNISNLGQFQLFLKMCAGRTGQLLNLSSLANECGISHTTAKSWISVLEASYIVFRLPPYHENFSKRLVKMPKLYFYDPGLAAYLLGIESLAQLQTHYCKGALFESMIICEMIKQRFNQGQSSNCYFWRDKTGHEIDCLVDNGEFLSPMGIKSGQTITSNYFKGLDYFLKAAGSRASKPYLIYGGAENQHRSNAEVLSWSRLDKLPF